MRLNRLEKLSMNNPLRAAVQRRFEAPRLIAIGGPMSGGRALEVGCGNGYGSTLVLGAFGADHVDAFDLDPDMVRRARERLRPFGERARVWQGDAESIEADDETYDAVFDFGIMHHVPHWRRAVTEVARVLKPGGRFYAEEVLKAFILHPVWRRLFDHPMDDRFDAADFVGGIEAAGLEIVATRNLRDKCAWFVADKPLSPTRSMSALESSHPRSTST